MIFIHDYYNMTTRPNTMRIKRQVLNHKFSGDE